MTPQQIRSDIYVKVIPKSSRNQIVGREGDVFKVKLTAPPVEGMANDALIGLLSKNLGIPKKHIAIKSGKKSRLKALRIYGLSIEDVTLRLEKG
jgi:uncharacterized protein